MEAVNNIPQSVDNDSDFDVEAELPSLKVVLSEEVYRKLKPKERKRQDVINGKNYLLFQIFRECLKFLNRLYDITWFGAVYAQ